MLINEQFLSKAVARYDLPASFNMYFKHQGFKTLPFQYEFLFEIEIMHIYGYSRFTEVGLNGACTNDYDCAAGLICDTTTLQCSKFSEYFSIFIMELYIIK